VTHLFFVLAVPQMKTGRIIIAQAENMNPVQEH